MSLKIGIATGGPIFYKLVGDDEMSAVVSGETVALAKIVKNYCSPGQLFLERTTFECGEGLNIKPKQVGEFEYQGKHNSYYSIVLEKDTEINVGNVL